MTTSASLVIRAHNARPFYEAKFRCHGRQVMRRVGPAWLDRAPDGSWHPRRGRVPVGFFDERRAHVRAAELVAEVERQQADQIAERARRAGAALTFRELANDYMRWLEIDYGARPTTLRDHRYLLAEPETPHRRGSGVATGSIMAAFGDRPATEITTDDLRQMLSLLTASGVAARTVNKHRNLIAAIFNHGAKRATGRFKIVSNPAVGIEQRREPKPAPLLYFTPDEIERIALALGDGRHRQPRSRPTGVAAAQATTRLGDAQDAEAVRLAAYTGLRRGELVALRWRDVDYDGAKLTVARALSAGVEGAPKSGRYRDVPLPQQAADALNRLAAREEFTAPEDLVLCNAFGRHLDPTALGRRYNRARDAIGLRPLRWHDLRHTFGSLLVAAGVDTVSVKAAMGHERITTTERYLHARPAGQQAAAFTAAFRPAGARAAD